MERRKIVVGVDFTDASLAAARWAAARFAPDAEIVLVHVVGSTFTLWLPPGAVEPVVRSVHLGHSFVEC